MPPPSAAVLSASLFFLPGVCVNKGEGKTPTLHHLISGVFVIELDNN